MSKKVLTVDLETGKKKLETVIDNVENAAGREDMAYSAKAVDEKVDTISKTITSAVGSITANASYQNVVNGIFRTTSDAEGGAVDQRRYAIGNLIQVYTAEKEQQGEPGQDGYTPRVPKSWKTVATVSNGAMVVNLTDLQEYIYDSSLGRNGYNETSWKRVLDDKSLVHTTGDETIAGHKTFQDSASFANDVIVEGNFVVNGTTTTLHTKDLVVKDNIIVINDGDTGLVNEGGITTGAAGIEINRGNDDEGQPLPKAKLMFVEEAGTFQAGLGNELKDIAVINDSTSDSTKATYSITKINALLDAVNAGISNSTLFSYVAADEITVGQIVYVTDNGRVSIASNNEQICMDKIAGVAMKSATSGTIVQVAKFGKISKLSDLVAGTTYFLGEDGAVTSTCPTETGSFICKLGVATDDTTILLQIDEAILIA